MFGGERSTCGGRSGLKDHRLPLAGGCDAQRALDLVELTVVIGHVNFVDIIVDSGRAVLDDGVRLQRMPQGLHHLKSLLGQTVALIVREEATLAEVGGGGLCEARH
ncbi:Uncharacterised protein [Mycobacteroides abscessus subsp. massiliense]|nr:Uncharacterised protein [Mycobacteroides abscessus subsp. massiliense]